MSIDYVGIPFRNIDYLEKCNDFDLDEKSKLADGWIYMMSNPAMPGIVKIGMTTTSPEQRCKELSSSTSVPIPFELVVAYHVSDPSHVERAVHEILRDKRVNSNREFFKATVQELEEAMEEFGAVKHGDCKLDFLIANPISCFDKFQGKSRTVKITEESYADLDAAYGNPDDLAEMAIKFLFGHVRCNLTFKNGRFIAIPDACYAGHEELCNPEEKPVLLRRVEKNIFGEAI